VLPGQDLPQMLAPVLQRSPETAVVLIQNGIAIEGGFPAETPVISVVAYVGVTQTQAGIIEHQTPSKALNKLAFGGYVPPLSEQAVGTAAAAGGGGGVGGRQVMSQLLERKVREFAEVVSAGGVEVEVSERIEVVRWHKLLWNATFNPISILAGGVNTRVMLTDPETELAIRETMAEVQQVAYAVLGIRHFPEPLFTAERYIELTKSLSGYKPSMLVDFEEGRPMEVEAIVGNTLRAARKAGVPTPRLQTIYALISAVNNKALAKM